MNSKIKLDQRTKSDSCLHRNPENSNCWSYSFIYVQAGAEVSKLCFFASSGPAPRTKEALPLPMSAQGEDAQP